MPSVDSERYEEAAKNLAKLREELRSVALDEESEAVAYASLAASCKDPDTRWLLFIVAFDSILHRELAWAMIRAASEAELLARELAGRRGELPLEQIGEELRKHVSIENLAQSNYRDLEKLAMPGTTLQKLLRLLAEEEEKHNNIAKSIIEKITKRESRDTP